MTESPFFSNPFDSFSPLEINEIYMSYLSRNITISYDYDAFISIPNPNVISDSSNQVILNLDIAIPYNQRIFYIPSLLFTFKNAWIQYICLLIPIWFILRYLFILLLNLGVFEGYKYDKTKEVKLKTN